MSDLFPGWEAVDAWRSVFYALAASRPGGIDPLTAAARHREWCIRMGIEPQGSFDAMRQRPRGERSQSCRDRSGDPHALSGDSPMPISGQPSAFSNDNGGGLKAES